MKKAQNSIIHHVYLYNVVYCRLANASVYSYVPLLVIAHAMNRKDIVECYGFVCVKLLNQLFG